VRFKPAVKLAALDEELAFPDLYGRKGILWQVNPVANSPLGHTRVLLDGLQVHPFSVLIEFTLLRDHYKSTLAFSVAEPNVYTAERH